MKQAHKRWLRRQWGDLMAFYGVAEAQAEVIFADLVTRYEEDGRYYHTLHHIQNVLETIESLHAYAQDVPAIQLAAWFHDVIYDVRRTDNEMQSAVYAGELLGKMGLPPKTIAKVDFMIQATKHNRDCPGDIDCQIMLDADLATFASDWETQEKIEQAIRQEYAYVPDEVYRQGRQAILQNFLNRERIYCTDQMYTEREQAARRNIKRSIVALNDR